MRAVLQRVKRAKVTVDGEITGEIGQGILLLLGVGSGDSESEVTYLVEKTINLRIFSDEDDKMNLSVQDVGGGLLVVSQFTLFADTRKGRRPSYLGAATPDEANSLYEVFVAEARRHITKVETGRFQAMMDVELVNDGPVTIILDTANK
ncbi:MAG TPA: D-aminoacyl-tRNA deacylase [Pyrinomonadaceae bacterium]|nr:D-aminoacyl-tRNA deacylase [Pyrinomonadaceae bacterium]